MTFGRTPSKQGQLKDLLYILDAMDQSGLLAYANSYVSLLERCTNLKSLAEGKLVHAHIMKCGFKISIFLGNTLVNMYAKCGSVMGARQVFDRMLERDLISWNTMITGYTQHGHIEEALKLFVKMQKEFIKPDGITFLSLLKACISLASLEQGKQIHAHIIKCEFESDVIVGSTLVDMYAKCGRIEQAYQAFNKMHERDVVSWNVMLAGYVQLGYSEQALELFQQMQGKKVKPDTVTFISILKACSSLASLKQGKQIHAHIIKSGFESDAFVGSTLVGMYAKCGSIKHAHKVFDKMPKQNVTLWNVIVGGYACNGCGNEALNLFQQMQGEHVKPDWVTFLSILKLCDSPATMQHGKQIHAHIIRNGFESEIFVRNALVNMYAKCGNIGHSRQVFDKMPKQNIVSWNAMITGYARYGHCEDALKLFWQMQREGVKPDRVTFISVLKACTIVTALEQGKKIHNCITKSEFELDAFVGSTLIDMYSKCGSIELAHHVFEKMSERDVVSWTAMITGYANHGRGEEALKLFWQMHCEKVKPNDVTFVIILKVCASIACLEQGKQIHAYIKRSGFESDIFVGNTLVDMYAKCGSIEYAWKIFNNMPERQVTSWNVMFAGYVQHGHGEKVLKLFWQMQQEGVKPDRVTFITVLKACASIMALEQGKQIHDHIIKSGLESDTFVRSTLIDMYAKCGSIEHARQVFGKMPERDAISWTAMLTGYAQNGHGEEALQLFWHMQGEGVKPDRVTFISVLKACVILAALEQGKQIHGQIIKSGLESDVFVGSTLVDMYAKCGSIENARQVFDKMSERNVVSWNAMIAGYAQHGHGIEALKLVERMQQDGLKLDVVTFTSILSACNHSGLLDEGCHYFDCMTRDNGITPLPEHYACMVDLLARVGHLEKAENLIMKMPCQPTSLVWGSLLGACRIHSDVELARHTAECVLELEPESATPFVLLSNIYAAFSRWEDKTKVRKLMEARCVKKQPGRTWIEVNNPVHSFIIHDALHPQLAEVQAELR